MSSGNVAFNIWQKAIKTLGGLELLAEKMRSGGYPASAEKIDLARALVYSETQTFEATMLKERDKKDAPLPL